MATHSTQLPLDGRNVGRTFSRGLAYWLVAVAAMQAGVQYAAARDAADASHLRLLLFATFFLPCFVLYAGVYDSSTREASPDEPQSPRAWREFLTLTPDHVAFLISALIAVLMPFVRNTYEELLKLGSERLLFLALFLLLNIWYAFFLKALERRSALPLFLVRFETFTPVLLIALYYFVGATLFLPSFRLYLAISPLVIFLAFLLFHRFDRQNATGNGAGQTTPGAFAFFSVSCLIGTALLPLGARGLNLVDPVLAGAWFRALIVGFAAALYLSLYEVWRLTYFRWHRLCDAGRMPEAEARQAKYNEAALVSHGVALVALPLMFAFGGLGGWFLILAMLHAIAGFVIWYRSGPITQWTNRWLGLKLLMALTFFGILAVDIAATEPGTPLMSDYYPRDLSGVSASLLVAVLVGLMAVPFGHYLMQGSKDGQQRPKPLREIAKGFFRVSTRSEVYRLTAVLSGLGFIFTNFLYEAIHSTSAGDGTADWVLSRLGLIFWLFAAETVAFSALDFFSANGSRNGGVIVLDASVVRSALDPSKQRNSAPGPTGAPTDPKRAISTILLGILQTIRLPMGSVIFAGVALVGVLKGGPALTMIWLAVAVTLVAMGSFALNDFYDAVKDRVNAPHRAIPSGRLRRREAFAIGLGAIVAGSLTGARQLSGWALLIFATGCVGALFYNEVVRRAPAWKVAVTAALCALVLTLDVAVLGLGAAYYWICAACFVFVFGRELLMDVRDIAGDSTAGLRTMAVLLGRRRAGKLGYGIVVGSVLPVALFLAVTNMDQWDQIVLVIYAMSIFASAGIWFGGRRRWQQWTAIELLKIPLLCGIGFMVF